MTAQKACKNLTRHHPREKSSLDIRIKIDKNSLNRFRRIKYYTKEEEESKKINHDRFVNKPVNHQRRSRKTTNKQSFRLN